MKFYLIRRFSFGGQMSEQQTNERKWAKLVARRQSGRRMWPANIPAGKSIKIFSAPIGHQHLPPSRAQARRLAPFALYDQLSFLCPADTDERLVLHQFSLVRPLDETS